MTGECRSGAEIARGPALKRTWGYVDFEIIWIPQKNAATKSELLEPYEGSGARKRCCSSTGPVLTRHGNASRMRTTKQRRLDFLQEIRNVNGVADFTVVHDNLARSHELLT
jgi:hypothetical protein